MLLVTTVVFLILRVIPGDPARLILAGEQGEGVFSEEDLANLRHELGTDRAIIVQYGDWLWGLLRGDFGLSLTYRTPITEDLAQRIPITVELGLLASLMSVVVAVPLGILSAVKLNSIPDYAARLFTFTGISIPIFVVGIVVIYLLVRIFGWIPPLSHAPLWDDPWTNLQQMFFPALSLAFLQLAFMARVTRSAMLEVLREDYIRTARAKGLREQKVIYIHALRNAFLPIVTVLGWALANVVGGTVIIERIFVVPGMGTLLIQAISQRDYAMTQAIIVLFAVTTLTVNLGIDLLYSWLDPRIRYA